MCLRGAGLLFRYRRRLTRAVFTACSGDSESGSRSPDTFGTHGPCRTRWWWRTSFRA